MAINRTNIELLAICAFIAAIPTAYVVIVGFDSPSSDPSDCTCRFAQQRVHFGDQYTKVNRKCIDLGGGSVRAGDTTYLDVKWFTNDCD